MLSRSCSSLVFRTRYGLCLLIKLPPFAFPALYLMFVSAQEVCPAGYKRMRALESDDDVYPPIDICNRTQVVDFMSSNVGLQDTPSTGLQYYELFTSASSISQSYYVSNWQEEKAIHQQFNANAAQVSALVSSASLRPLSLDCVAGVLSRCTRRVRCPSAQMELFSAWNWRYVHSFGVLACAGPS